MLGLQYTRMALDHWREHLPNRYRQLKESGTLDREAQLASREAAEQVAKLMDAGMQQREAEEMVLPDLILLPPETASE